MRNIINISMPEELAKSVKDEVKSGKYASTSEFFRHLVRNHNMAKELEIDRKKFELGEGKELRSFKDLR